MQIHLPRPSSGLDVIAALQKAFKSEPKGALGRNRSWEIETNTIGFHFSLGRDGQAYLDRGTNIVAELREGDASDRRPTWKSELRTLRFSSVTHFAQYMEITMIVGTVTEEHEREYFDDDLNRDVVNILRGLVQRFYTELLRVKKSAAA